ncbi:SanA/YdcF family protein [Aquimarina agarivorans]|uniref:SanA/YdcF family protein n=1 Tax=Aquimarina agarivorans TaxID=980584 RepID=UPI000248E950|nr:ElyC/SanA/YdcF family protein [Aquimarina agarivorans]
MIAILCIILIANKTISASAKQKLYASTITIPKNKIGLLLGTSKYVSSGQINLYYQYRIQAAAELYHAEKIEFVLVSGDNSSKSYNEPKKIKEDLIKQGIPANKIVLDYAGFRTLDSVVRAQKVFGEPKFTIISQQFHNERALFLADRFNCDAIAYNAKSVSSRYGLRVKIREYFARVKVFIDLMFNIKPKFLGDKITIG